MVDKEGEEEHFDCLLVGAGISGLDAAYHIQKQASGEISSEWYRDQWGVSK